MLAIGIAPLGIVSMGVVSIGAVGMGLINACVVGMGVLGAGVNVMGGVVGRCPRHGTSAAWGQSHCAAHGSH